MLSEFKRYLVKNYGYDGGHSLMGPLLGLLLFSLGVAPAIAAEAGALAYAVPKEIWDRKRSGKWTLDNLSDLASYHTSWPAVYLANGDTAVAMLMAIGLALVYSGLVLLKLWRTT